MEGGSDRHPTGECERKQAGDLYRTRTSLLRHISQPLRRLLSRL